MDVATASEQDGKINWHLNDRCGGFLPYRSQETGKMPHDITAIDLDLDGHVDLVTVTVQDNRLNIHYGDGKGEFAKPIAIPTGMSPRSVKAGDLNNDGRPDVVVGADDGHVHLHHNAGGRQLQTLISLESGKANWGLGLGDLNKDGILDIVVADYAWHNLGVHLSSKEVSGGYLQPNFVPSGEFNFDLKIEDMDLDGDLDVVTASTRDMQINIHTNDGKGILSSRNRIQSGNWNAAVAVADFDGDADPDVLSASIKDNSIHVHRNVHRDPNPQYACYWGKVRDADTRDPIQAIIVVDAGPEVAPKVFQSDEKGVYDLCGVTVGKGYEFQVKAHGYASAFLKIKAEPSVENSNKRDFELKKATTAMVRGQVKDIKTGKGIPNANISVVNIHQEQLANFRTDNKGNYESELPIGSNHEMIVKAEGYTMKYGQFSLNATHLEKGLERNFDLYTASTPTTNCLEGYVRYSDTKIPIPQANVALLDQDLNIIRRVQTDDNGYYKMCVPSGNFIAGARKPNYFYDTENVTIPDEKLDHPIQQDLYLYPLRTGMALVLKNMNFPSGSHIIEKSSVIEMQKLAWLMELEPGLKLEVSGHTDSDGDNNSNLELSDRRANYVIDYLHDNGIQFDRCRGVGFGENVPIVPNDTPKNKRLNRRTEVRVLEYKRTLN